MHVRLCILQKINLRNVTNCDAINLTAVPLVTQIMQKGLKLKF